MKRAPRVALLLHAALVAGAVAHAGAAAVDGVGVVHAAGEANTLPAAAPAAARRRSSTTSTLFTRLDLARALRQQPRSSPIVGHAASRWSSTRMAGYAFAKLRFRGRDRLFRCCSLALVVPAQVGMLPLFLLLQRDGAA